MGEAAVRLTRAAVRALDREAHERLINAAQEMRFGAAHDLPDEESKQTADLLASADIVGTLYWSKVGWRDEDLTREIQFSDRALEWLGRQRDYSREHVEYLDEHDEGSERYQAKEAFLLHVLNRIVSQDSEAVAV